MGLLSRPPVRPPTPAPRTTALLHHAGALTMGVWGVALLVWPDRVRARLGDRALPWYQREVALFDLGQLLTVPLSYRSGRRTHLLTMSVTTLLLSAGHAVEAVRHRDGRAFHGVTSVVDACWGVSGLRCALRGNGHRRG